MGSSVETCIAWGLAAVLPVIDEVGDVLLFSLRVPIVLPSAIPADATEIGSAILAVRAAAFSFRGFDEDPLPDDQASDDVGGGGKSCATTVA